MPELTRLAISADDDNADLLLALLAIHVPHGWEEQTLPTGEVECIVHSGHPGFCRELSELLQSSIPTIRIESTVIQEENWAEAWKEFFTPVEGGDLFLVLPPWMQQELAATSRIPIIIEPKTAFGTGHHATTALCLEVISFLLTHLRISPETRFLDLGTGSGILGIGCAKAGLTGEGLDIDLAAVDNAVENREINAVPASQFALARGGIEAATGTYDLILANILAAPLRDMAADIVAAMHERGILVLSGMLAIQADSVAEVYQALGLPQPQRFARDEWVALLFER